MKWICKVCGYVHEGAEPPDICPVCKVGKDKFEKLEDTPDWGDVHKLGQAKNLDERVVVGLRKHYDIVCNEIGVYLAMGRQADSQGYPEIANTFDRLAHEESIHAGRLAEMLGEQLVENTEENIKRRIESERFAVQGKQELSLLAKDLGYEEIHSVLRDMAKDKTRHSKILDDVLKRYFFK